MPKRKKREEQQATREEREATIGETEATWMVGEEGGWTGGKTSALLCNHRILFGFPNRKLEVLQMMDR